MGAVPTVHIQEQGRDRKGLRRVQVYKGVLRETGEEVAIKVQRPGVRAAPPHLSRTIKRSRSV